MKWPAVPTRTGQDATLNFDAAGKQFDAVSKRLEALEKAAPRFVAAAEVTLANGAPGAETQIKLPKVTDSEGWYNETTHLYVPLKAGLYIVEASFIGGVTMTAGTFADVVVRKNKEPIPGALSRCIVSTGSLTGGVMNATGVVSMNGTTDELEIAGNSTMAANKGTATFQVYRMAT